MKKIRLIAILMALIMVASGCGDETEVTTPVDEFADVDESTPEKGVYKIHTKEGVLSIAEHPKDKFEILCNIDMEGAELKPIGTEEEPFSGKFNGGFYTISNFKISAPDDKGNQGIFGVVKGSVTNVTFDKVEITSTADTKVLGGIAAVNKGNISKVGIASGTITAKELAQDAICGGAIGINTGKPKSVDANIDVIVEAAGKATIGAFAGTCSDCALKSIQTKGKLVVCNAADKLAGFIAGEGKNVEVTDYVFLGKESKLGDKTIMEYFGKEEGVTRTGCAARDNSAKPLPENIQAMRDKVEQTMRAMGTVEWTVSEPLHHSCSCTLAVCHGVFNVGTLHVGIPYTHKGGSLKRFMYCLDENGCVKDWVYDLPTFDGWDMYMGNDCSTAVEQSWATVANSMDFIGTYKELPARGAGTVAVGNWNWDRAQIPQYTVTYLQETGEQPMYECYAQLRKGDAMLYINEEGGHTRMAAADAVVVRYEDGTIDPEHSYVVMHEQGAPLTTDPYYSTWRIDYEYSFSHLFHTDTAVPITVQELLDGKVDAPTASMEGGVAGRAGLVTGTVKANFFLDSVTMVITNEDGDEIFNRQAFTTVGKRADAETANYLIRDMNKAYDMAHFASLLKDVKFDSTKTYHCEVTANLSTGDDIVVSQFDFN